jgi:hypothetical protein
MAETAYLRKRLIYEVLWNTVVLEVNESNITHGGEELATDS